MQFLAVEPKWVAFMALNIAGMTIAAGFELVVTLIAIFELLVFMGVVAPAFSVAHFVKGGWSGAGNFSVATLAGIVAAIPFALGVMVFAGGSGDWTKFANINDPLPQAMKIVVGSGSGWLHMLVWFGLFA